ncbi:MAG: tetratricopeptide repeat protein [Pirellulaceae bacterium]|nr:tetratricopeptide repeat protein [Pirellulaceae bacterium]
MRLSQLDILKSRLWLVLLFGMFLGTLPGAAAKAADLDEAHALFQQGEYDQCIVMTQAEVDRGIWHDGWSKLLMRALMVKGQYAQAAEVYTKVAEKFSASMSLRLMAVEALRYSGKQAEARVLYNQIPTLIENAPWRFSDRDNSVALGGYFLNQGEDPREVLAIFYDAALKSDPKFVDAHVAIAELALSKNDYQEAVNSLKQAEKLLPKDPRIQYLLAKAWASSDSQKATGHLQKALELNPRHPESLLLQCEELLDGEQFDEAEQVIDEVLKLNALQPKAWALRAVIRHLKGEYKEEGECRSKALSTWAQNPAVDYEIGKKLSRFYRFNDAVQYLRRAISLDANYMPARFQLAQDLLRLNAADEGWTMVDQVSAADKYNVVAANLRTLRERLAQFTTIETDGFIIRMDQREARIYGQRVVKLLTEAKRVLCEKYDFKIVDPVNVEIFPQQSDFAIRTFGLPGGAGFLGVCFGKLITANSPASQGDSPSNWESVLWHEFCHVVTLQKTNNRMPRWLSEGLSVSEELQRDASWGQSMTPIYREMILGDDFVPLSKLSSAFLQPPTPMHLQFAYFESSLAVRYMIEQHGLDRLKKLLVDLGMGVPMQDAVGRIYGDADILDADFKEYVTAEAKKLYTEEPDESTELPARISLADLKEFVQAHPKHYKAARQLAAKLAADENWPEALAALERLDKLWPRDAESGGVLESLAAIYRKLDRPAEELATLQRLVANSSDNVPALSRLIELAREAEKWDDVSTYCEQLLAVQPLISLGHTALAEAALKRDDHAAAAEAYAALLELQPIDAGRLHYELAAARFRLGDLEGARQHVLLTLEETPRYRSAQQLLVQIADRRLAERQAATDSGLRTLSLPDLESSPPAPEGIAKPAPPPPAKPDPAAKPEPAKPEPVDKPDANKPAANGASLEK